MEFKSEYYKETQIESIIFNYGFKKGVIKNKEDITEINFMELNEMKLPISMNPLDFGKLVKNIDNGKMFVLENSKGEIIIISHDTEFNEVEYFKNNKPLVKFKDEFTSEN
jgi:hypothetical protein